MNSKLSGPELIKLKNTVVDNFDSSNWRELAALTDTLDEVERHPRLLRSLSFGDDDYDGLALTFLRRMVGTDDINLDTVRDYIAKNCPTHGENISSVEDGRQKLIFNPQIFTVPREPLNPNLISVMMPFSHDMKPVYESIKIAASNAGYECKRADNIWEHATVIQDVFSLIFRSFIVVCDFTSKNPNVFYEAGIAHTLGKHVVPITQSKGDIPFDIQHHRYAIYLNNNEGRTGLIDELTFRFLTLSTQK